jgi:hypothetical protein
MFGPHASRRPETTILSVSEIPVLCVFWSVSAPYFALDITVTGLSELALKNAIDRLHMT